MKDYYQLLEITQSASADEIALRIKEKKRLWVQRQNAPRPEHRTEAEQNLRLIPEIEATLLDPERRRIYDIRINRAQTDPAASDSEADDDLVTRGWELLRDGRIPDALDHAVRACRQSPDDPVAWQLRGHCEVQWEQPENAIECFSKAIALKPNAPLPYYFLGEVYLRLGDLDAAEREIRRAKQIDPDDIDYDTSLAEIEYKRGNYDGAIGILEQCLERDPENYCRNLLAVAYRDKGMEDWEKIGGSATGNQWVDTALEVVSTLKEGKAPNRSADEGLIATRKEHLEKAAIYLRKAEDLRPGDPDVAKLLSETRDSIAGARKRSFYGDKLAPALWAIFGMIALFMGMAEGSGEMAMVSVVYLGVAGAYVFSCMTPGYLVNRRIARGKVPGAVWDMVTFSGGGCLGTILIFCLVLSLLPFVAIANFFRNYVFLS